MTRFGVVPVLDQGTPLYHVVDRGTKTQDKTKLVCSFTDRSAARQYAADMNATAEHVRRVARGDV